MRIKSTICHKAPYSFITLQYDWHTDPMDTQYYVTFINLWLDSNVGCRM